MNDHSRPAARQPQQVTCVPHANYLTMKNVRQGIVPNDKENNMGMGSHASDHDTDTAPGPISMMKRARAGCQLTEQEEGSHKRARLQDRN